jgi:hypothetical protein
MLGIKDVGYLLNRSVDLDKIFYGGDAIIGDFKVIMLYVIVSTILKWLRFKFVW